MSEQLRVGSRMSHADALMFTIEKDPPLRSPITAVATLDQSPARERLTEVPLAVTTDPAAIPDPDVFHVVSSKASTRSERWVERCRASAAS